MGLSIMEQAQADRLRDDYLPCPFCGSHDLRITDWADDSGEYDAVECCKCLGTAPATQWNTRADDWRSADQTPDPEQNVVMYYEGNDGRLAGPIIATPNTHDGRHLLDGKPILKPALFWQPVKPLPGSARQMELSMGNEKERTSA